MASRNRNRNTADMASPKINFTAPTPGLKYIYFTQGNIKASAEVGIVCRKLARHISSKENGVMGSKAMEEIAHLKIIELVKPIQEYRMDNYNPQNRTGVPVLDYKVYRMKVDKYMLKYTEMSAKKITWVELNEKIYSFYLQHSPPDLELLLKANSIWDKILVDQSGIRMLHVIWDVTHKQDENMQITIAYINTFPEFSTTYEEPKQSNTDYYALFKLR